MAAVDDFALVAFEWEAFFAGLPAGVACVTLPAAFFATGGAFAATLFAAGDLPAGADFAVLPAVAPAFLAGFAERRGSSFGFGGCTRWMGGTIGSIGWAVRAGGGGIWVGADVVCAPAPVSWATSIKIANTGVDIGEGAMENVSATSFIVSASDRSWSSCRTC